MFEYQIIVLLIISIIIFYIAIRPLNQVKEFKINHYLKLKLEGGRTNIYVNNRRFIQCMYLLLNIPVDRIEEYDEIESIDEASVKLDRSMERNHRKVPPETEFWGHYLRYFFIAEDHSKLYLSYSNNTIFNVKDQNNQSLLSVENYFRADIAWYLNFTQLSYIYSDTTTILLSNVIFIEMYLDYGYYCGNICGLWYSIDQYLVLSPNLDALMIFIPHTWISVS